MIWCIAVFLFLIPITSAQNGSLPACPEPPYNNAITATIVSTIESLRPCLVTGVPARGIPPLDPFVLPITIPFDISSESVTVEGYVKDTTIYNLAQFIICEMTVELGLRQSLFTEFRFDSFKMEGYYDMDGVITSLFPLFGNGTYRMEVFDMSFALSTRISVNPISLALSVSDLEIFMSYQDIELFMECLLGCGFMADWVNGFISEVADILITNLWMSVKPGVETAVENLLNEILKGMGSVNELTGPNEKQIMEDALKREFMARLPIHNNEAYAACVAH